MPDYEKMFIELMQRLGEIEREIVKLHDEMSGRYLEERLKEEYAKMREL